MITGIRDLKISSDLRTPTEAIPTPAFAQPYPEPKLQKTRAAVIPMNPKKVYWLGSYTTKRVSLRVFVTYSRGCCSRRRWS